MLKPLLDVGCVLLKRRKEQFVRCTSCVIRSSSAHLSCTHTFMPVYMTHILSFYCFAGEGTEALHRLLLFKGSTSSPFVLCVHFGSFLNETLTPCVSLTICCEIYTTFGQKQKGTWFMSVSSISNSYPRVYILSGLII